MKNKLSFSRLNIVYQQIAASPCLREKIKKKKTMLVHAVAPTNRIEAFIIYLCPE